MGDTIQIRRGTLANLPDLQEGEPGWVTDTNQLYIGTDTGTAESAIPIGSYDYIPSSFTQAAIETTLTAIGTTNKATLLLRPGTWVISTDADYSTYTNVTWKIPAGALLQVASTKTLTIGGPIEAGPYQIFSGAGAVAGLSFTYPEWRGAVGDGATNDYSAILAAANSLTSGGLLRFQSGRTYICNTVVPVSVDNVLIDLNWAILQKTASTGYIFSTTGAAQKNFGIINGKFIGYNTTVGSDWANGGVNIAERAAGYVLDGLLLSNLTFEDFGQYGVNVGEVDNATYNNVKVLNHGSTTGTTVGIGFVIYPAASNKRSNHKLINVTSIVNPDSSILASAAMKLQNIWDLQAANLTVKNGTESVCAFSQLHRSTIDGVAVFSADAAVGLLLQSYNSTAPITITTMKVEAVATDTTIDVTSTTDLMVGDSLGFVMDDANIHWTVVTSVTDADTIVIEDAVPTGRTLEVGAAVYLATSSNYSNIKIAGDFSSAALSYSELYGGNVANVDMTQVKSNSDAISGPATTTVRRVQSRNIRAQQIAFALAGQTVTNCTWENLEISGAVSIRGNDNKFSNVTAKGRLYLIGNNNKVRNFDSISSASYGLHLAGDTNNVRGVRIFTSTLAPVYIESGSGNEIADYSIGESPTLTITDSGTATVWGHRLDTSAVTVTGTVAETNLKTLVVYASSMGKSGIIKGTAWGTKAGANDTKTIKLYWGTQAYTFHAAANNTTDWRVEFTIANIGSEAVQQVSWVGYDGITITQGYEDATEDTTAAVTLKLMATLANIGDTVIQKAWEYTRR